MAKFQNRKSNLWSNKTRSKTPLSGLDSKLFVKDVTHLKCGICLDVYNDPQQCKVGHIYCKGCFVDYINFSGGHSCPTCDLYMTEENLSSNLFVKNIIAELLVTCPCLEDEEVKDLGCKWTGTLVERSCRVCPRLFGDCPNDGCDVTGLRLSYMKAHKLKCPRRPTLCAACNTTVPFDEFQPHNMNGQCSFRVVDCDCGDDVRFCDMETHLRDVCAHATIPCPILQEMKVCSSCCTGTVARRLLYSDAHLGHQTCALVKALFQLNLTLKKSQPKLVPKLEQVVVLEICLHEGVSKRNKKWLLPGRCG